jgi:hypothetical protein
MKYGYPYSDPGTGLQDVLVGPFIYTTKSLRGRLGPVGMVKWSRMRSGVGGCTYTSAETSLGTIEDLETMARTASGLALIKSSLPLEMICVSALMAGLTAHLGPPER